MTAPRVLLKLGGAALQTDEVLATATDAILRYRQMGYRVIMVHGGGPAINDALRAKGIEWTFVGGQRVTTPQMMETIEATLCGEVNKRVVRYLNSHNVPAIGFSGAEHKTLLCRQAAPDLGQVGSVLFVNADWLESLLALPTPSVPVMAPIGVDHSGKRYNINADWSATHLAVALKVDELIFLTDINGILDEEGSHISRIDTHGLLNMIEAKTVNGGMLTKSLAVLHALQNGVKSVRIVKGEDAKRAADDHSVGTSCHLQFERPSGAIHAEL